MDPKDEKKENNNQKNDLEFDNPYQDAPEMNEEIKLDNINNINDTNKSEPEKKENIEKEENKNLNLNENNEDEIDKLTKELNELSQINQINNNQNNIENNNSNINSNNKNNSDFNPFENKDNIDISNFGFPNELKDNSNNNNNNSGFPNEINNNNNNNNNFGFNQNNINNNNDFPSEPNNNNNSFNPYRVNDNNSGFGFNQNNTNNNINNNNNSGYNPYRINNNNDSFKFNSNNMNNNNSNYGFNPNNNMNNNNNNNYGFNRNNSSNFGFNNNMNDNNNNNYNNNYYRSNSINNSYNGNQNNYNNNYNNNSFNNNYNNNNYSMNNNNNNSFNNYNNNNYNNNNNYSAYNPNNSFNNNNYNNSINNMFPSVESINTDIDTDFPNINDINEQEQIKKETNRKKESKDKAIMSNIIKVCDDKFKNAVAQFKNYQLVESKKNLKHIISSLNTLEQSIKNQKQFALDLIPNITTLKTDVTKKLNEYNYFTYILEQTLLKNIQYSRNFDLPTFAAKFIIKHPYSSFDDIFDTTLDNNKPTRNMLLNIFNDAQFSGYKSLFLYGPKGSGKTLYAHALASEIGGVIGQINDLRIIKINYFVKEFARVITECTTKPIIIFLKNIETMTQYALNEILFLHDKFNTEQRRVLFICSSQYPLRGLPYQLKFKYVQLINGAGQKNKYNLFKFYFSKFGINFKMSDDDLNNFVTQNFRNYSNKDVFFVVKQMMDIKKQKGENIYDLGRDELEQAMKLRPGSLDQQSMQYYYL